MPNKKKCIIVDDDSLSRSIIRQFVSKTASLELVAEYDSAVQAAEALREMEIDIIFLDIEMPDMTGIEFLRNVDVKPTVILITGKEDYAIEAFDYEVKDYLLKPVSYARFLKAVNRTISSGTQGGASGNIFVKVDSRLINLALADILYIEAMGDYISIVTVNQKYTAHSTLTAISNKLNDAGFMRVHRSFIVNIAHIAAIEDNTAIVAGRIIPLGSNYKEALIKNLNIF